MSNLSSLPEAVRARPEPEDEKHDEGNPQEGRCAPLGACQPRPGEAATCGRVAAPFLPTNQRDLDLDDQNNDDPGQEPAMGSSHGVSPGLAASRPILGAVAVLGSGSCRRERKLPKSPALKAKIKYILLPNKQGRFLTSKHPELLQGWLAATHAGRDNMPFDPVAWQTAIDGVALLMERENYDDMRDWKRRHKIPYRSRQDNGIVA